jgi:hypothetical protein
MPQERTGTAYGGRRGVVRFELITGSW